MLVYEIKHNHFEIIFFKKPTGGYGKKVMSTTLKTRRKCMIFHTLFIVFKIHDSLFVFDE